MAMQLKKDKLVPKNVAHNGYGRTSKRNSTHSAEKRIVQQARGK